MSFVLGMAFSPDGRTLTSATDSNMAFTWQMPGGTLLRNQQGESGSLRNETLDVVVSAGGDAVAFVDLTSQRIYLSRMGSPGAGTVLRDENQSAADVWSLAFSPSGRYLAKGNGLPASASYIPSTGMGIPIWEVSSGKQIMLLKGHTGNVNSIAWNADDSLLVSGSSDGTVRLWKVRQAGRHA